MGYVPVTLMIKTPSSEPSDGTSEIVRSKRTRVLQCLVFLTFPLFLIEIVFIMAELLRLMVTVPIEYVILADVGCILCLILFVKIPNLCNLGMFLFYGSLFLHIIWEIIEGLVSPPPSKPDAPFYSYFKPIDYLKVLGAISIVILQYTITICCLISEQADLKARKKQEDETSLAPTEVTNFSADIV